MRVLRIRNNAPRGGAWLAMLPRLRQSDRLAIPIRSSPYGGGRNRHHQSMSRYGVTMSEVVQHHTYVAASCTICHGVSLRICVSHDQCEFRKHALNNYSECAREMAIINETIKRATRDIRWLTERGFTI